MEQAVVLSALRDLIWISRVLGNPWRLQGHALLLEGGVGGHKRHRGNGSGQAR